MNKQTFNDYTFRFLIYLNENFPVPQSLELLIKELDGPFIKRVQLVEKEMGFSVLPVFYTDSFTESIQALRNKIKTKHAALEDAIRINLPIVEGDIDGYIANKDRVAKELNSIELEYSHEIDVFNGTVEFLVDEGYVRNKDNKFILSDRGYRDLRSEVVIDESKKSKVQLIKERIGINSLPDAAQVTYNILEIAAKLV